MSAKRRRSKSLNLSRKLGKPLNAKNRESSRTRRKSSVSRGFQELNALSNIRDWARVDWNDLLGREEFHVDLDSVRHVVAGKVVLVTGAAGSIGSKLCRRILECRPAKLVCL